MCGCQESQERVYGPMGRCMMDEIPQGVDPIPNSPCVDGKRLRTDPLSKVPTKAMLNITTTIKPSRRGRPGSPRRRMIAPLDRLSVKESMSFALLNPCGMKVKADHDETAIAPDADRDEGQVRPVGSADVAHPAAAGLGRGPQ